MADSLVKQLLEAGVHFGHKASNWNPKMKNYIFGKRNGIHIIDVRHTIRGLLLAKRFVTRVVASGKDVLFVGTKRQARVANFRTIRPRLKRLEELETLMSSEEWENYSKKMASQLTRERRKIHRNLAGIRHLTSLPGALVVIDVKRELNALREAQKLGIPTVCMIDTDSDPDLADIPIPGNDDAMRAIELIIGELCTAANEGKTARAVAQAERKDDAAKDDRSRRRSTRARFRADAASPEAEVNAESAAEQKTTA